MAGVPRAALEQSALTDRGRSLPAALDRRFEAAVVDWDAALGRLSRPAARRLRDVVQALSRHGFDVAIVSGAPLSDVDSRLAARPDGPGRLHLYVGGGTHVYEVGGGGPVLVHTRTKAEAGATAAVRRIGGFSDTFDSVEWALDELRRSGLGPDRVVVVAEEPGAVLEDQLDRRLRGELPLVDDDPEWTVAVDGLDPTLERAHEALLTLADGVIGTSGAPLLSHPSATPRVLVAGVYEGSGAESHLLHGPGWTRLPGALGSGDGLRRVLDLRSGLLFEECPVDDGRRRLRSVRFSSVASPGTVALRAEAPRAWLTPARPLDSPPGHVRVRRGRERRRDWAQTLGRRGGVAAAARDAFRPGGGESRIDRVGAYVASAQTPPAPERAVAASVAAEEAGFERLLREHRGEWGRRWADADVRIEGDSQLQQAVRFALFQLMGSVADRGESGFGARGLTGTGYRGHVFWDAEVFVLPFLAATRPEAARAMLEYRIRRLPAARRAARLAGYAGARFPWESAHSGLDVTPSRALIQGVPVAIWTGELEEHIVSDVAWGASCYLDWTGDEAFRVGPGLTLFVETARYWASRIRTDDAGRGHIDGVIGPDEYHEGVDDNAYTNVMARWNLRRAAEAVATTPSAAVDEAERARWLALADALVDGYDPATGIYEEFAGFSELEPLVIREIAPRRPVAAELLLGQARVRAAQVVKQADVLMLHHLVPDEVAPDSLLPNLSYYEPRTAHGSSLSPGIHASLFARAGLLPEAVEALRLTSRIDLDDLTDTTAAGLHVAAMGSLWQALVFGFAGIRPVGDAIRIDPHLPADWRALELGLRFRGERVRIRLARDELALTAAAPTRILVAGHPKPLVAAPAGLRLVRRAETWKEVTP